MRGTLTMALVRAELCRGQAVCRQPRVAARAKVRVRAVIGRALRSVEVLGRRLCTPDAGARARHLAASETSSPPD